MSYITIDQYNVSAATVSIKDIHAASVLLSVTLHPVITKYMYNDILMLPLPQHGGLFAVGMSTARAIMSDTSLLH